MTEKSEDLSGSKKPSDQEVNSPDNLDTLAAQLLDLINNYLIRNPDASHEQLAAVLAFVGYEVAEIFNRDELELEE